MSDYLYIQDTGQLFYGNVLLGTGYSGHGLDVNSPSAQNLRGMGPIPVGFYTIGPLTRFDHIGPAVRLTPDPANQMFGRDGFLAHCDNSAHNRTASEGCIVQLYPVIEHMGTVGVGKRVQVIAYPQSQIDPAVPAAPGVQS